jgi:predicted tellurium resistance membrane protein TerC
MAWVLDPQIWLALVTLTTLEIVLGIDNIIFISILAGGLPEAQQPRARYIGLLVAMLTRVLLLCGLNWVMGLTQPWLPVFGLALSGRDLILLLGGLFLLAKSTLEMHKKMEEAGAGHAVSQTASFVSVIVQIGLLDIIFSLDSVITAIGMSDRLGVMVAAVVIAVIFMMAFSGKVSDFVNHHPTVKMLALSFLLLIADGLHHHIPKGYIYFAMAFAVFVEMLNLKVRAKAAKVKGPAPHAEAKAHGAVP